MSPRILRPAVAAGALAATAALLAACTSPDAAAPSTASPEGLTIGAVDLSGVCPDTVVIQTDWNPQAEQGGLFNLLGDDATIDASDKVVRGPLYARGEWTGVDVEIRAGGPAIGFTGVPAQMYLDPDILLGWVSTDEAVANSAERPTTAVMATFEKAPWIIMWDPATYPDVETIADLGETDATVRYFGGTTYMDYLVGSGQVRADQLDGAYDGSPANFVAAQGKDAQQGFATVEPWVYEHAIEAWMKPVEYQLVADTGYPIYAVALSVRSDDVAAQADCLEALVPVIQQSTVDYFADPDAANALLVAAVDAYDTGWIYPREEADNSVVQQRELGLAVNAPDGTFGAFDLGRVDEVLSLVTPILSAGGVALADGLTADDLATNAFLDPAVALP